MSWDAERALGVFQHDPAFAAAGIELAPFVMPAREAPYEFPALGRDAFKGLPGLLADALPDAFGNRLMERTEPFDRTRVENLLDELL